MLRSVATETGSTIVGKIAAGEQLVSDSEGAGIFNAMERGLDCCKLAAGLGVEYRYGACI